MIVNPINGKPGRRESSMARVATEIVRCFACGYRFERVAVVDIDPGDKEVLEDESLMRGASTIRCPTCEYEETRPVEVRRAIGV